MPEISIIMPVSNTGIRVAETLKSIQTQSFQNYEVICVQAGSRESVDSLLRDMDAEDHRFRVVPQIHAGMGGARNDGLQWAVGRYTIFLEEAVVWDPTLLERLWNGAEQAQADAAVCDFLRMERNGKSYSRPGIQGGWLPKGTTVFSYRNCPHRIMNIWGSEPWNKLYRSDFLRKHSLAFEEMSSQYDVAFAAVSAAAAEQIVYIPEQLMRYWVVETKTGFSKTENLINYPQAISSAIRQAKALPHSSLIEIGICFFAIYGYTWAAKNWIEDFHAPAAEAFYTAAHNAFQDTLFDSLTPKRLQNQNLYGEFFTVRKHSYRKMQALISQKRIVVSVTSFPARIQNLSKVLDTIYAQTLPADRIVLWLAWEQFPNREADLPRDLMRLVEADRLEVRWCKDLKAHKKYFYALQEFTDDLVVTIDDDLLYPKDALEALYKSYLMHPDAVSTLRAHLITFDEDNRFLPYDQWIMETDACIFEPSMQLFATGGAGDLYPPNHFHPAFFDEETVMAICPWADNIWVKTMEAIMGIPVVVAKQSEPLRYLPGSQEETLFHINGGQNQYDIQLAKIKAWLDDIIEPGILEKCLADQTIGVPLVSKTAVLAHLDKERQQLKSMLNAEKNKVDKEKQHCQELRKTIENQQCSLNRLQKEFETETNRRTSIQTDLRESNEKINHLLEEQKRLQERCELEKQQLLCKVQALEEEQKNPKALLDRLAGAFQGKVGWFSCKFLGFLLCARDHGVFYSVRYGLSKAVKKMFGKE